MVISSGISEFITTLLISFTCFSDFTTLFLISLLIFFMPVKEVKLDLVNIICLYNVYMTFLKEFFRFDRITVKY